MPDASTGEARADWNRGRYLANALGHCAECHTPRGKFGQLERREAAAGCGARPGRAAGHHAAGLGGAWLDGADLQTFFATGIAPQGSAFGEMHPVVHLSSQYLSHDDLRAMSTYLLGDAAARAAAVATGLRRCRATGGRAQRVSRACVRAVMAVAGEGKPHVAVSMQGNSTRASEPIRIT